MSEIRVRVLLFARAREIHGSPELEVRLAAPADVTACFESVAGRAGALRDLRDRLLIAVNEQYADWMTTLEDGDVVAFIPPVSGGAATP